ncbi:uncharacterized protein LOC135844788 [Planococcus citri]|uniref:uncharacterized protein LOC135844788 n=1 Tax=Planococcus citri TaxID=170843 RepID=UPI0031F83D0E
MNEIPSDSYFENIQLIKLVSSAEALLQQLYKLVSFEEQQIIDQWLCFKREFDHCSSTKFNLNPDTDENSIDDNACSRDDHKSYSSEEVYSEASIEEINSEREDDSSDENSDPNLLSSGFESESHNDLDAYSRNFKMYTESLVSSWFNNMNLDSENSCGDHISNQYFYPTSQRPFTYHPNLPMNMTNNAFLEFNDMSDSRFCHCCANGIGSCHLILSLPVEEQIAYVRELKTPLIQSCHQITSHTKRCDFESKSNEDLIMLQEVLEAIDITIEMKNNDFLAEFELEKFKEKNHLAYSSMFDCFKMLSSNEMHYLFVCFLNKTVTLRENSSNLDKLILQLDNTIVDKEIRLRYLNKSYIKLRDVCISLKNKSKNVPEEPVPDNLEAIINVNKNQPISENNAKDKAGCSQLPSSSTIPNKSIKALHRSSLSKNFGVTCQGKKLIIQEDKNS